MNHRPMGRSPINPFLIGGLMVAAVGLFMDVSGGFPTWRKSAAHEPCQGTINTQNTLSRETLAQMLTVPERDRKDTVQQIVGEPYCQLQSLQIRAGVTAERQVYPLAFDPQTRLVILYEGDEYAGYRFSFQ